MKSPLPLASRWLVAFGAAFFFALLAVPAVRAEPDGTLVGHFEYAGARGPKQIVLDLTVSKGEGGALTVGFSGEHADGSGAAPDGDGKGKVDAQGVLHFDFEDSFNNRGKGTLRRAGAGACKLDIKIEEVKDARCLPFYGEHTLKRSAAKDR